MLPCIWDLRMDKSAFQAVAAVARPVLAASVALLVSAATAGTLFTAPNKVGGQIKLTDLTSASCSDGYRVVISTSAPGSDDQNITRGCWRAFDGEIHIIWRSGQERMWSLDRFEMTDYASQKIGNRPAKQEADL